ncbi:MAG TPA: class I SAM-dependent methyltransferase [Marmoricola sp.]|nr:class I SAM-dependent methyltransferase [Marmoricola sp.]
MDAVAAAFDAVPRVGFLREASRSDAGFDGPLAIGHGQTNSQPRTVEDMLRLLDVHPGHRVLDVGSGSGWTTALLGHLVGPDGLVVGVEIEPDLASWGEANVRRAPYSWASVRAAEPGVLGAPDLAPFDRILVSAGAREVPADLVDQLADQGRMVVPVNGTMTVVVREDGLVHTSEHGSYRFVPLR